MFWRCSIFKETNREILTDRQGGGQRDKQAKRQAGRKTDRQTGRQRDKQAKRQAGRQAGRQTGRQAEMQTATETDK